MGAPRTKLGSAYAAMSKLVCADLGMKLSTQAVQVHGAAGLDASSPPAMLMRDAKVVQMIDGTSEVQKLLISRFLAKEIFLSGVAIACTHIWRVENSDEAIGR
ncbi:hypothetical protein AJ88_43525 [Mesorhizobium amorphae CCBAU 01583]|nr:hypothetical protein AJ88_43525 [Mesorhizobium amorphae CCBAU 01583]